MSANQVFEIVFMGVLALGFGIFICRLMFDVDLLNVFKREHDE